MSQSLVIRNAPYRDGKAYTLTLRESSAGGVDYHPILRLSPAEACAISGSHTGIHFLNGGPANARDYPEQEIRIEKLQTWKPMARPWVVRIGENLVTLEDPETKERKPLRISDEDVLILVELTKVTFDHGQPDWDLRNIELIEERAEIKLEEARALQEMARVMRERLMAARAVSPDMAP